MKVVQFIYPMFLVALGMHALLLFVPIGGAAPEPIEEDVPFSDLTSSLPDEALVPDSLGALPVPDLNVSTASPDSAASRIAASQVAGSAASVRPAAPMPQQPIARATARPATPTTRPSTATRSDTATRSGTATRTEVAASQPDTATQSDTATQPATLLPNLSAADQDSSESAPARPASESAPEEVASSAAIDESAGQLANESVRGLIASARGQIPASLRQLAAAFDRALDYNPEGTDEASAEQALTNWQASIRRQARGDGVENIEPIQIAELSRISYPIESAAKDNGRPFSVCLEKAPHDAEIGVLFDAQGQIAGDPKLIRSTGYSALNEEIMATLASYQDFPVDHRSNAYTFEVRVDYAADACVSLEKLLPSDQSSQ